RGGLVVLDRFAAFWSGEGERSTASDAYHAMAQLLSLCLERGLQLLLIQDAKRRAVSAAEGVMGSRAIATSCGSIDRLYLRDGLLHLAQIPNGRTLTPPT